jgi:hypothetical protein
MRFMASTGLAIVVYIALAYTRRFNAGCDGTCTVDGTDYGVVVLVQALIAALVASLVTVLVRGLPSPRYGSDLESLEAKKPRATTAG